MGRDWEALAGEKGKAIPTGRLARATRLGRLGLGVAAGALGRGIRNKLIPGASGWKAEATHRAMERQAKKIVDVLGNLKGASMKIGQILSSDPDLVPPEFASALASLQTAAPPMPWTVVTSQIERAFDQPIDAIFDTFDPEPCGAASIGQVHRAVLRSGEEVAVKIQYPGILQTLESDLDNLATLMTLGRALVDKQRARAYLDEARSAVLEEADYLLEARNMAAFHEHLAAVDGVRAPRPVDRWCTRDVLTMTFAEGQKLDDALLALPMDERVQLAERFLRLYMWFFFELNLLHADPHPGNFLVDPSGQLVVLDFGCAKVVDPAFSDAVLDLLIACWQGEDERIPELYVQLGFGKTGLDARKLDAGLLRRYHEIVLEPFMAPGRFDFEGWRPATAGKGFILRHPSMLRLIPPADALLVLRVASGVKGLLSKAGVSLDVHRVALGTAHRRERPMSGP